MQIFSAIRLFLCLVAVLAALPAFADIAAFNAAVKKGDFKAAAAEAATTWATLDKSRGDIAIIAREFGFASFVAGDHAAAKNFAEFAAGKATEADRQDGSAAATTVLLRLSEHKLAPSPDTRGRLVEALEARGKQPGLDAIGYFGAENLLAYDFEKGRWNDAEASAKLAVKLTNAGGDAYAVHRRRFELFEAIANYRATQRRQAYLSIRDLHKAVVREIEAAPNEDAARRYVPLYWEITAWQQTIDAHLSARGQRGETREDRAEAGEEERDRDAQGNYARVIHKPHDEETCPSEFNNRTKPEYPLSAMFQGYVGSVVLQMDIDETGKVTNPEILAAVPDKYFGEAVLRAARNMSYRRGKNWNPSACSLAEKKHVIVFQFKLFDR